MNGSPIGGAAAADAPLGRIAASGLGRVALAGLVLVLAAVVVTMSGGAGLGGRLGALFGLHSRQGGKPVSAIQVAAPAAVRPLPSAASGRWRNPARSAPEVRLRTRHPAATGPQRTEAPSPRPTPAVPSPVQPPAPAPPPVQPPSPPKPAPSGTVQRTVSTVREIAAPVVPAPAQPVVQPVLDQAEATVNQVCGLIGGCP